MLSSPLACIEPCSSSIAKLVVNKTNPKRLSLKGLGRALGQIPLDAIQPQDGITTEKLGLETLTSYTILPKRKAIIVPGYPAIWNPPKVPCELKPDAGLYPLDSNRLLSPGYPLEPLFRALLTTKPDMKMNDIDLVTDRRNLRHLLHFVGGRKEPSRIDVEVVNNTVFLSHWSLAKVNVTKRQGYGYEFEKASTRSPTGNRDSMTHYRVIRYTFGGLRIMMRHEVDGCIGFDNSVDTGITALAIQSAQTQERYKVIRGGDLVSSSRIIEIKTKVSGRSLDLIRTMPQLWFSHTHILCAGYYDKTGTLTDITQKDYVEAGLLQAWEESHQQQLKKLAALLRIIVELARTNQKKYALVLAKGKLTIFNKAGSASKGIPIDLQSMWE